MRWVPFWMSIIVALPVLLPLPAAAQFVPGIDKGNESAAAAAAPPQQRCEPGTCPSPEQAGDASGQPLPAAINQRSFSIPFSLNLAEDRVVEALLYYSRDQGNSWVLHSRQNPSAGFFPFQCESDGQYWFAIRITDRDGHTFPQTALRPELVITVDTEQPVLELQIDSDSAGRVVAQWRAIDANLDASSIQLQYRADPSPNQPRQGWTDVPAEGLRFSEPPVYQDKLAWWPAGAPSHVTVRVQIADRAANHVLAERQIVLQQPAGLQQRGAPQTPGTAGNPAPQTAAQNPAVPAQLAGARRPAAPDQPQTQSSPRPPQPVTWPSQQQQQLSQSQVATGSTWHPRDVSPPAPENNSDLVVSSGTTQPRTPATNDAGVSATPAHLASLPDRSSAAPSAPRPRDVRWINSTQFNLDYDLSALRSEEVKEVALWATADAGRTWNRWDHDIDNKSPFPVKVAAEGVYGFCIVLTSREGMPGRSPQRGDNADIWIGVDRTEPQTRLTSIPYGEQEHAGKLIINWTATDENLGERPIKLSYSTLARGPWTTIAAQQANQGRFVWNPGAEVPSAVYLRVDAQDAAGNIGFAITDRPIDLSALVPRGRIRGVQPVMPKTD